MIQLELAVCSKMLLTKINLFPFLLLRYIPRKLVPQVSFKSASPPMPADAAKPWASLHCGCCRSSRISWLFWQEQLTLAVVNCSCSWLSSASLDTPRCLISLAICGAQVAPPSWGLLILHHHQLRIHLFYVRWIFLSSSSFFYNSMVVLLSVVAWIGRMFKCIYNICTCFGFMLVLFSVAITIIITENKEDDGTEAFQCPNSVS